MIHDSIVHSVTIAEASRITGIHPQTLKRHIDKGILDAEQADKRRRYSIDLLDLKEYACYIYRNTNGIKMYDPFICFDANRDFYLYGKLRDYPQ
jgi:hypothetical protein